MTCVTHDALPEGLASSDWRISYIHRQQ